MLYASPESTCDVCLESFSWTDDLSRPVADALKPHALGCGHIFCLGCLLNLTPSICPLCRHPFSRERIKKLHVGPIIGGEGEDKINASEQLIQLTLACKDRAPSREISRAIMEAQAWIVHHPDSSYCSHIENFLSYIRRTMEAGQKNSVDRRRVAELEMRLARRTRELEDCEERWQAIEETLLQENEELTEKVSRLTKTQSELNFWNNEFPNSTHSAPQIRATQSASAMNATSSNPLPAPPRPVNHNRFYQNYDYAAGSRAAYERSTVHPHQPQLSFPPEATKQPGMYYVPGAPYHDRVIPTQFEPPQNLAQSTPAADPRPRERDPGRDEPRPVESRQERRERFRELAQLKRIEREEATRQRGDAIMPGNALGIDSVSGRSSPVLRTPLPGQSVERSMSYQGEANAEAGPSRVVPDPGVGSASTSVSMVPAPSGARPASESSSRPRTSTESRSRRESLGPQEQTAPPTRSRIPPPPVHPPYDHGPSHRRPSVDVAAPTPIPPYGPYPVPPQSNANARTSQASVVSALNPSLDWDTDGNSTNHSVDSQRHGASNGFMNTLRGLPGPQPAEPPQPTAGPSAPREPPPREPAPGPAPGASLPGSRPAMIDIVPSFSRSNSSARSTPYPGPLYAQPYGSNSSTDERRSSHSSMHHQRQGRSRAGSTAGVQGRAPGFPHAPAPVPPPPVAPPAWPYRGPPSSSSAQSSVQSVH